jgi:tRNA modification GTPase
VGLVQLEAPDAAVLDESLRALGLGDVPVGGLVVRDLLGVDRGVLARWSPTCAHLMPHGGVAIVRALADALRERGLAERTTDDPRADYSEAATLLEARMLAALARAASPLAVDLLLDQPARWAAHDAAQTTRTPDEQRAAEDAIDRRSRVLNRLIDPPLVVAVGGSNIGKSTLLNALAGRQVSIVADEPGTTRDHVGVTLDLGGLVVRYVDTPGVRADAPAPERDAAALAAKLAATCDLLVLCADATTPVPPGLGDGFDASRVLRVGLRADLGTPAGCPGSWAEVLVSVREGRGLEAFVGLVRERLVPSAVLTDPGPWRWWGIGTETG